MPNAEITPARVRFFLMDRCAKENYLLDAQEFTDKDINDAFELMVAKFNSTDPILSSQLFGINDFPYLYEGCIGIAAMLLRSKAINMVRNRLQDNGQIVNDKQNAEAYLSIANNLDGEFEGRVRRMKMHANINGPAAFGRVGGMMERPYGWS